METKKKEEKAFSQSRRGKRVEKWKQKIVQIQRVSKVLKGGKKMSFRVVMVVGNQNSQVGVGIGKADDVSGAIKKAVNNAKKNLIQIPLTKTYTVPHATYGHHNACKVFIKPASGESGVLAGSSIRTVLELAGVKNVLAKQLGSGNLLNNARATINALKSLKTIYQVAEERDLPLEQLFSYKS